ncbi:MAG TPA: cytochrome c3 family protein [Terriglobia bacterium]|nr:cytochrome c3 family protein [Terriglobia bacterium]
MPQVFHRSMNTISRVSLVGAVLLIGGLGYLGWAFNQSPYYTNAKLQLEQPVPFSHKHHTMDDGIDCRYCHTSVEKSSFAGIPPTETCMTCHSQIWTNASMLEPVRASYATGQSLEWARVNALPDFVYFNHSIHVKKGIGCTTCHGQLGEMPITWKENTLYMRWCIDCHKHPEQYVRRREDVFKAVYHPPANQVEMGRQLVREYKIRTFTNCETCHR